MSDVSFPLVAGWFTLLAAAVLAYAWWEHKLAWKRFELALDRSIGPLSREISGIGEDLKGASSELATLSKDFAGTIGLMDSVSNAFHPPDPGRMVPRAAEPSVSLGRVNLAGIEIEDLKGSREEVTRFLREVQGTFTPEDLMKQLEDIQARQRQSAPVLWKIDVADWRAQWESAMKKDVTIQEVHQSESIVARTSPEQVHSRMAIPAGKEKPVLH